MATEATIVVERRMQIPVGPVFDCFRTLERMQAWFTPPGVTATGGFLEFREGGALRLEMTGADGRPMPAYLGQFTQIAENRLIAYDAWHDHPGADRMQNEARFSNDGAETLVRVVIRFESLEARDRFAGYGMAEGIARGLGVMEGLALRLAGAVPR